MREVGGLLIESASGDTSAVKTVEDFDQWLDQHATDIALGPPLYHRVIRLAELGQVDPAGAVEVRRVFRERWIARGWFPTLNSLLEAALRAGRLVSYFGPCPHCRETISVELRDGRIACPHCGVLLVGARRPSETS